MDPWNDAQRYEQYVGRWSRVVARKFIDWVTGSPAGSLAESPGGGAGHAPAPGSVWLDVGCGTGALLHTIQETTYGRLAAIDRTLAFLQQARRTSMTHRVIDAKHLGWIAADAMRLPLRSAAFDFVVSGLVFNFLADPAQAAAEMRRVTRPGGTVALYVWDYAGEMQFLRYFWEAAGALDPAVREMDEGRRFPICHPDRLREVFEQAGLQQAETTAIDIDTVFQDFDDFWSPFLGGQGPAPGYVLRLDEERRAALRERLRAELPAAADGSIRLVARAWAVRGVAI